MNKVLIIDDEEKLRTLSEADKLTEAIKEIPNKNYRRIHLKNNDEFGKLAECL